jgi:excisionase family DNA binding protein
LDITHETSGWYADRVDTTYHDGRIHRLTVNEAAQVLNVSASAVRKRVERGTLPADKDEDGRLFVYVDTEETDRATRCTQRPRSRRTTCATRLSQSSRTAYVTSRKGRGARIRYS